MVRGRSWLTRRKGIEAAPAGAGPHRPARTIRDAMAPHPVRAGAPLRRRGLLIALLAAVALLALPALAQAHAQLERTSPGRDALVAKQPALVAFTFSEPVSGTAGAVRVFNARGERVDEGDAQNPGGRPRSIGVGLRPGLADGTYTATYRVVSADGHIVSGGSSFSVGRRGGPAGATVGDLLAGQRTGAVTENAFVVVRAVQFGAIAVGTGALLFLLLVWLGALSAVAGPASPWPEAADGARRRLRLLVLSAAGAGAVSAVLGVVLEAATAAGVSFWSAVDSTILGDVLDTRFGTFWAIAAGLWVVAGAVAALAGLRRGGALVVLSVPLVLLLALPGMAGHSSVQSPVWLLLPANILHVAAMAAWAGGLVALLVAVPAATRRLEPPDRTRLLAATLARFSPLALLSVIVLLATGIAQSLVEIDAWSELLDTAFGRAVLIKFVLLLVLVGLGAVNRRRTVPRLRALAAEHDPPGQAGVELRRTLRAEVLLVAVVIAVTGALAGYPPAKTASTGPVNITTDIGPRQLQLTVDPATVGANELHLYLLDARTGAPFTGTRQLTVTATQPDKGIGPLPLRAEKAGPGHFVVSQAVLGAPGTWKVRVTDRVSAFDEYDRTVDVRIR